MSDQPTNLPAARGGPRTPRGKSVARLNPTKHAVLAQTPVIPLVERLEDWERLKASVRTFYQVTGAFEEALADRIAGYIWRLGRVQRFESQSIEAYLRDVPRDWRAARAASGQPIPDQLTPEIVEEMDRMLMARLLPGDEILDKILRYETKFHRLLTQAMDQMAALKARKEDPTAAEGSNALPEA